MTVASTIPTSRPRALPLPMTRVQKAYPQVISGRRQLMDSKGGFALTNLAALEAGGQTRQLAIGESQLAILAIGDIGKNTARQASVIQDLKNKANHMRASGKFPLILGLGDWQYPRGPAKDTADQKAQLDQSILDALKPIAARHPIYSILGNHEYGDKKGPADPILFNQWAREKGIQIPGRYYNLEIEADRYDLDIFALDTTTIASDLDQQEWFAAKVDESLQKERKSGQKRWRVLVGHHPPISHGSHQGENTYLIDLLKPQLDHMDLYLAGHEHEQDLIYQNDLPPIVINGSGSKIDPVDQPETPFRSDSGGATEIICNRHRLKVKYRNCLEKAPFASFAIKV